VKIFGIMVGDVELGYHGLSPAVGDKAWSGHPQTL